MPRFHVAWGTGTGIVKPFADSALEAAGRGLVTFFHRHRVDDLVVDGGAVTGVRDTVLAADTERAALMAEAEHYESGDTVHTTAIEGVRVTLRPPGSQDVIDEQITDEDGRPRPFASCATTPG